MIFAYITKIKNTQVINLQPVPKSMLSLADLS